MNKKMKFNKDRTSVELSFKEVKQLKWSVELFEDLDESRKELEQNQPRFKFFKNFQAEIVYGPDNSVNIGEQGVEGEEWKNFLKELQKVEQ